MPTMVRVYVDVCHIGRGLAPGAMSYLPEANNPGYAGTPVGGSGGVVPNGQTLRFQVSEIVPGTMDSPTAANIGTAITSAATDIQAQITTSVIAQIVAWATGGE